MALDLGGYTLTGPFGENGIKVLGKLNLCNGKVAGNGIGNTIVVNTGGILVIENGAVVTCKALAPVAVQGEVIVNGGTVEITNKYNTNDAISIWDGGKVTVNSGIVSAVGTADAIGSSANNIKIIVTINGGDINGNIDFTSAEGSSVEIRGGTFDVDVSAYIPEGYEYDVSTGTVKAPAPAVAQIGDQTFETLEAAFAAVQNGDEVKILVAGSYTLPSGKNITVTGTVPGVEFDNINKHATGGANITFNNVTFNYAMTSSHNGLQHSGNLVYNNCIINGQVFLYGTSEIFNNCTFNQTDVNNYNVWTYSAKNVAFNGCTFNSAGRSVLIYGDGGDLVAQVAVTDCKFVSSQAVDGKAAIEMDSSLIAGINLTIDNATTATGFGSGSVSDNSLWNNKKGNSDAANNDITVVVNGETVLEPWKPAVAKIGDTPYETFEAAFAAAVADNTATTITLIDNVTLAKMLTIPEGKTITLDLNGKTINGAFDGSSTTKHIYALTNNGTLTITDTSAERNGAINSRGIHNYGSLTLNAGKIAAIDGNGGYAVNNKSGSTFVMNGGVVAATYEDDYKNSSGGYDATALNVLAGATATLNGGKIINVCDFTFAVSAVGTLNIPADSTIEINGTHGAINVAGGTTTINAGTFKIPADEYYRSDNVIYVSGGKLVINGGTFTGDSDTASGGSCLWDAVGTATVNGGNFSGSSGGDVLGTTGTTIKGGTFSNLTETQHIAAGYELNADGQVVAKPAVAKIGDTPYATLAEAVAAVKNGETITLLSDLTIVGETFTIADGKAITLDMNGKKITATDNKASNVSYELFYIEGGLTVTGNGTIELTSTSADTAWAKSSTIFHNRGGVLTIENGTFKHLGGTAMAFVVDNNANERGDVVTNIGGGTLDSTYIAIRNRMFSKANGNTYNYGDATLNISGGTINGTSRAIWGQTVSNTATPAIGAINITGGTIGFIDAPCDNGAVCMTTVTGGTVASFKGEVGELKVSGGSITGTTTILGADGKSVDYVVNSEGLYVELVKVAQIGEKYYASLAEALAAAQAGQTITLLADLTSSETIVLDKAITLDGNGKTLTYTGSNRAIEMPNNAEAKLNVTLKNLTVDCTASYCQRGINYNDDGAFVLNKVTVKGTNVTYALNLPGYSDNCVVTITDSNFSGNIALNVWGANSRITATDSEFVSVDKNTAEGYVAISLNNDGAGNAATGSVVTINGGKIIAKDENGEASTAVRVETTATVNVSKETEVVGDTKYEYAIVIYEGYTEFYSFDNLQDAINKAIETNGKVVLINNITIDKKLTISDSVEIDGNGFTITYTGSDRVIDVPENTSKKVNVTIKNLTVDCTASYCQRGINYNDDGNLTLNNVTVKGTNLTYALNLPGSSDNCVVTITDSSFTGNIALNVWGANSRITADNSVFTSVDKTTAEGYVAISLNNDGAGNAATGSVVTINGGKIIAKDENGNASTAVRVETTATVNVSKETEVVGDTKYEYAIVTYEGSTDFYSFDNLQDAIDKAIATNGKVVLINNITTDDIIIITAPVVIDGNGFTLTSTAARAINVSGANGVTIKNLTINASGERAINIIQNATNVTIENVTATAANYTVNVAASAPNAVVAITNSTLNGLCTVNVASAGAKVTIDNSTINCNDNNTTAGESYAALCLNKAAVGGSIVATNTTVNVTEGSDSEKGRNGAENGTVTINGSTEGVTVTVAVITYAGSDNYHGFTTLAGAIKFAKAGDTITLLRDVEVNQTAVVPADKTITLNLNGHNITSTVTEGFAAVALTNSGNLTINGEGTITGSYGAVYNDLGATLTINGGTYEVGYGFGLVNDGDATINGGTFEGIGTYNPGSIVLDGGTVNVGTDPDDAASPEYALYFRPDFVGRDENINVEINGGVINGNVYAFDGGVGTFESFDITGGTFNGEFVALGDAEPNPPVISGGTFSSKPKAEYCAEGFTPVKVGDKYSVGVLPDADVTNLGAITVGPGGYTADMYKSYDLINGGKLVDAIVPYDLTLAMDFKAKDTAEQAAANKFGGYTTDFFIKMEGMSEGSFVGDGCYLAGYYPSFKAWVKIPLDGFTVENNKVYPVITSAGFDFKYTDICSIVGQFICGIYLTPEVLKANPNLKVNLTLGLSENKDAALNAEFEKVDGYVYDADDLMPVELPEVEVVDIKSSLKDSDPDLTFALNFKIKDMNSLTDEYLEKLFAKYGNYYTDYVLTISGLTDPNGTVKFNANGGEGVDGYLAGQYDAWSKNWVSVPFSDVTIQNGQSLYIMEYAAKLMGKQGLRFTLAEVAEIVQNFDCGVYFTPEFLAANSNLKVDLELKVFTEDANGNKVDDISVATNEFDKDDFGVAAVVAEGKQTQYFKTLADAIAAADGKTVRLLSDVVLTDGIVIETGKNVTLDLAGFDITRTVGDVTAHTQVFLNNGTLTITDSADVDGEISLTYTGARNGSVTISTIRNYGVLNVAGGTVNCISGNQYISYAIDAFSPGTVNISGGKVTGGAQGWSVRMFLASTTSPVTLNVTGGEVGYVWAQQTNENANKGVINVEGGKVAYVYIDKTGSTICDASNVSVSIKTDATTYEPHIGDKGHIAIVGDYYKTIAAIALDIRIVDGKPQIGYAGEGTLVLDAAVTLTGEWTKNISYTAVENDGDDAKTWVTPAEGYFFFKGFITK